jgi:RNA polymerase sigma factor (TIGR02999 family)
MNDQVDALFKDGYVELLKLAHARLAREQAAISTITLAHELYLKLQDRTTLEFPTQAHFFAYSSRAMRSMLIDMSRERVAQKRSAALLPLTAGWDVPDTTGTPEQLLALDDGLQRLGQLDPRLERVAELRVIMGMDIADTAMALNVSEATIKRDWQRAKAYLHELLGK